VAFRPPWWVFIACETQAQFGSLCEIMGHGEPLGISEAEIASLREREVI
jgi:hypothetical protein